MGLIKKMRRAIATWPVRGYVEIEGWLSDKEARTLYDAARKLPKDAVVVEIGSWQGKSTYCLAKGLKSGVIHAIDPFDTSGEEGSDALYAERAASMQNTLVDQFEDNLRSAGLLEKVRTHKGYSQDFIGQFPNVDLLFIDGDHSIEGCKFDFENFAGDVKIGGLLALHDYQPARKTLGSTFVVESLIRPSLSWTEVLSADSLIIFRRSDGDNGPAR